MGSFGKEAHHSCCTPELKGAGTANHKSYLRKKGEEEIPCNL
jgi:hypothetical protein